MSDRAPSPFIVNGCRGTTVSSSRGGTCRFSLPVPEGFLARLERVVAESGWPEFLRDVVRGPILHHHAFRVAVSACPNGCSRPHIADVGIIRAWTPGRASDACTRCGLCERLCPDHAMTLGAEDENGPRLHPENCLSCGLCIKRCPEKALPVAREGWRVVVGGRLGRRPPPASRTCWTTTAWCAPCATRWRGTCANTGCTCASATWWPPTPPRRRVLRAPCRGRCAPPKRWPPCASTPRTRKPVKGRMHRAQPRNIHLHRAWPATFPNPAARVARSGP